MLGAVRILALCCEPRGRLVEPGGLVTLEPCADLGGRQGEESGYGQVVGPSDGDEPALGVRGFDAAS
jgi:hypothetical protein